MKLTLKCKCSDQLTAQSGVLAQLVTAIQTQSEKVDTLMLNTAALTAEVTKNRDVIASALAIITELNQEKKDLSAQLAKAIADNDPVALAAVQKAIDDSVAQVDADASKLASAVAANTPADPPAA